MGVTRYDDLPENQLVRNLHDARQVSRERKGSNQRTGGANLAFFVSETTNTYDWVGLIDGPTGSAFSGVAQFIVTLTAPTAATPLIDAALVVYYSSDGGLTYSEYTQDRSATDAWNLAAPGLLFGIDPLTGVAFSEGQVQFIVGLNADINTRAAFKLQAVGTDEVVISVVRTA